MIIEYHPPSFVGNTIDLGDRRGKLVFSLQRPRVAVIDDFLDDEECEAMIENAANRLEPATVFELSDGSRQLSSFRTSWHAKTERANDTIVKRIETRTSRLVGCPDSHGERIEVIRYQAGQRYRPHWDWFDPETDGGKIRIAEFGQRIATVIMYLNDGFVGGSTAFPRVGLDVRPKKGAVLFFSNIDEKGMPDRRSLHEGAPVLDGEKMIATRWFNSRSQININPGAPSDQADKGNGAI